MTKDFCASARSSLLDGLPENSIALIYSGQVQAASNDTDYPFEVNRNFYYFTSISQPGLFFMACKTPTGAAEILFIPRVDLTKEKWTGKMQTPESCNEASGISDVRFIDEMENVIASLASRGMKNLYLYSKNLYDYQAIPYENVIRQRMSEKYPGFEIRDLSPITEKQRSIKADSEIDKMKIAARLTKQALDEVVSALRPGMKEYEAQAVFEYTVKRHGGNIGFNTITASGENAVSLHYTSNQATMPQGDLLLIDCGASYGNYCADVTRTYPVSGSFTEEQLKIYNIVLGANEHIISLVKPGTTLAQLDESLIAFYEKELAEAGLIDSADEIAEYYYHSVSHSLGLDVHDALSKHAPLEPGMVITVEPGLYFSGLGIGIRIEDDVLVTENGNIVLTSDIAKAPNEIEEIMNIFELGSI
ncbi:MAG: aminopeptidase P family protein [Eubacteriaceae bacterium]|nr:aminopeptidase P family protein [Eubacteriaceae bacterium]